MQANRANSVADRVEVRILALTVDAVLEIQYHQDHNERTECLSKEYLTIGWQTSSVSNDAWEERVLVGHEVVLAV